MLNLLDMSEIFCIIYIPEPIGNPTHNQQKVAKEMASSWNLFFYIREYEISCNISTDHISENVQNKIYNFKIRFKKFTHQTKKAKKYWLAGTELSYMIMLKAPNIDIASVSAYVRIMLCNL